MGSVTTWLTILSGGIGLAIGALFTLDGFARSAAATPIGQSPRIKNLLWVLSGFGVLFAADFKKVGLGQVDMAGPFIAYGICALLGIAGALGLMWISIVRTTESFNRTVEAARQLDAGVFAREYFAYGKASYDKLWAAEAERARAAEAAAKAAAEARSKQALADKTIGVCTYAALAHTRKTKRERRDSEDALLGSVLAAMEAAVMAQSPTLRIRASYMQFMPASDPPKVPPRAIFVTGMPDNYLGFLELRHGGGFPNRRIVLPVARAPDFVLPGAPEAAYALGVSVLDIQDIRFRSGVAEVVRTEINAYFRDQWFDGMRSITASVIYHGQTVHGVVNLESSAQNLLGGDQSAAADAMARLQSLIALLSIVGS